MSGLSIVASSILKLSKLEAILFLQLFTSTFPEIEEIQKLKI